MSLELSNMRTSVSLILFLATLQYSSTTIPLKIDERVRLLNKKVSHDFENLFKSDDYLELVPFDDGESEDALIKPFVSRTGHKSGYNKRPLIYSPTTTTSATPTPELVKKVESTTRTEKPIARNKVKRPLIYSPTATTTTTSTPELARIEVESTTRTKKPIARNKVKSTKILTERTTKKKKVTRKTSPATAVLRQSQHSPLVPMSPQASTHKFSLEVLFRRQFDLNTPLELIHSVDMITPFFKGALNDLEKPVLLNVRDHLVTRFLQLLNSNTTNLDRLEKRSIMYHISKLNIRLFTWDLTALRPLYSVLTRAGGNTEPFTFIKIKKGIIKLLTAWSTDLTNATTLLLQSRVFRPPCLQRDPEGSSKFVRGSTIPMSTIKHLDESEDCNNEN